MQFLSVRARMTLWNVSVLACVLAVLGAILRYTAEANLIRAVDGELATRARTLGDSPKLRMLIAVRQGEMPGPVLFKPLEVALKKSLVKAYGEQVAIQPLPPPSLSASQPAELEPRILDRNGLDYFKAVRLGPFDPKTIAAAQDGNFVYTRVRTASGDDIRVYTSPLRFKDRVVGMVQVAAPLTETNRAIRKLTQTLFMLVPLALLVSGVGGAFLTDRALRPVLAITEAAGKIGAKDLSERLPVFGKDEFSRLATMLNGMLGRLQGAFEQQRRFTGDASHELRTPLAIIKATASCALDGPGSAEEYRAALEIIDRAADRTNRIVQDLLLLARSDGDRLALSTDDVPLRCVLQEAVDSFPVSSKPPVRLPAPTEYLVSVRGDSHHLVRLFVNLLENAKRHTPPAGEIRVTAHREGETVTVTVADTGEGIPPEHLPFICDRFYRVDTARSRTHGGTGLGLAICRTIVGAHGGSLRIESVVGSGTTVTVTLPSASA